MIIKLNDTVGMDLQKLVDSRLLIQANSGGGKSYTIRRIIEQAFGHVQIIVIDPEGEFGNMRSKFDFVYAGKGGDAPVESRSATLLAHRLLELKASAIVDLYELPPQERKHFVRLFCEAMVNASKELWHDTLIIIDEAHVFAPEKGESEAMGPVIDLATRGRKRGYCVVLATQRLPKLNKDAAAECNNKLIGRASQDIDRKRASEELGFTTKEQILSLRDLEPGEFYAFGPAISRDVRKIVIGDVAVRPPKRGITRSVPAPSATVKKMLGKLADLPQEAAEEARTVEALQAALRAAVGRVRALERAPKHHDDSKESKELAERVLKNAKDLWARDQQKFRDTLYQRLLKSHGNVYRALEALSRDIDSLKQDRPDMRAQQFLQKTVKIPTYDTAPTPAEIKKMVDNSFGVIGDGTSVMGAGERKVLEAVVQHHDGMTREHITVQTGYKRSTRDAYIQRLMQKGYVEMQDGRVLATREGLDAAGNVEALPTGGELLAHHLRQLPVGEAKILGLLAGSDGMTRDEITERTGFKRSTRDAYLQRLATRQLVVVRGQTISVSDHLQ